MINDKVLILVFRLKMRSFTENEDPNGMALNYKKLSPMS